MNAKEALDAMQEPDVLSKNNIFRVWYGLARLAHSSGVFGEAKDCWHKALEAGRLCGWEGKYPLNVAQYSFAHVLFELGERAEAERMMEAAAASIKESGMKYWTVGIGTYWLDYVEKQMSQRRLCNASQLGKMAIRSQSHESSSITGLAG